MTDLYNPNAIGMLGAKEPAWDEIPEDFCARCEQRQGEFQIGPALYCQECIEVMEAK